MYTNRMKELLLFLISSLLFLQGCGSPSGFKAQMYFPYVEEVILPDTIRANEVFQVAIRTSTMQDESLMNVENTRIDSGGKINYNVGVSTGLYEKGNFIGFGIIRTGPAAIPNSENTRDIYTSNVLFEEPGTNYLYVPSTRQSSQGGSSMEFLIFQGGGFEYPPESDLIEYREIVVEVLP